jgi:hypothetical protein
MEGPTTIRLSYGLREDRLRCCTQNNTAPHTFVQAIEKKWGIAVCVVCGKTPLYVAHDADLRV